jgi:hypothetical protein
MRPNRAGGGVCSCSWSQLSGKCAPFASMPGSQLIQAESVHFIISCTCTQIESACTRVTGARERSRWRRVISVTNARCGCVHQLKSALGPASPITSSQDTGLLRTLLAALTKQLAPSLPGSSSHIGLFRDVSRHVCGHEQHCIQVDLTPSCSRPTTAAVPRTADLSIWSSSQTISKIRKEKPV